MTNYEYFYSGTPYSMDPEYGELFTGYRMPAGELALTTDPRTANIIKDVSFKLNPGTKAVEISAIQPRVFEAMPDTQLEETRRVAKLTGAELSVHGPLVEPSGYTDRGWSETEREGSEKQIASAVKRSHKLDPKGNIPVTFHTAVMLPEAVERVKTKQGEKPKAFYYVDPQTGEIGQIKETEKYFPEKGTGKEFKPESELEERNREAWTRTLNELNYYALRGEEVIDSAIRPFKKPGTEKDAVLEGYGKPNKEELLQEMEKKGIPKEHLGAVKESWRQLDHGAIFLQDSYNTLRSLYNRVYKNASPEDKAKLDTFGKEVEPLVKQGIERDAGKLREFAEVIEKGVKVLSKVETPTLYKPLNDFLIDKSSETFSNVALDSYNKFGKDTPIISIENPPVGTALSRAEDIRKLIEESRKKFVEKAVKQGIGKAEAQKASEKFLGATWDVGHINMIRKFGYDKADVVKETAKIAPFIKHVHLSDNFGFEHTELPMGMGTVPIKGILEQIEKEGEAPRKVVEAGDWWQHFKTPPVGQTLEAFGSQVYEAGPYWNQVSAVYGNYFPAYGTMFPEQHFAMYGAGFSGLPAELGGQIQGGRSRMTGTPME